MGDSIDMNVRALTVCFLKRVVQLFPKYSQSYIWMSKVAQNSTALKK